MDDQEAMGGRCPTDCPLRRPVRDAIRVRSILNSRSPLPSIHPRHGAFDETVRSPADAGTKVNHVTLAPVSFCARARTRLGVCAWHLRSVCARPAVGIGSGATISWDIQSCDATCACREETGSRVRRSRNLHGSDSLGRRSGAGIWESVSMRPPCLVLPRPFANPCTFAPPRPPLRRATADDGRSPVRASGSLALSSLTSCLWDPYICSLGRTSSCSCSSINHQTAAAAIGGPARTGIQVVRGRWQASADSRCTVIHDRHGVKNGRKCDWYEGGSTPWSREPYR